MNTTRSAFVMAVDIMTNVLGVEVPTLPPSARVPTVGNQMHAYILSISLFVDNMPILGTTLETSVSDHNCFAPKPYSSHQQDSNTSRVTSTTGPRYPFNVEHLDDAFKCTDPEIRKCLVDGFTKGFSTGFIGPVPTKSILSVLLRTNQPLSKRKFEQRLPFWKGVGRYTMYHTLTINPSTMGSLIKQHQCNIQP